MTESNREEPSVLRDRGTVKPPDPIADLPLARIEEIADRRPRDAAIDSSEEELNKVSAQRIAANEAARRLPALRTASQEARKARQLLAMAAFAGDVETEQEISAALEELTTAAAARSDAETGQTFSVFGPRRG